jgi:putative heme-binding domain-containing protein
VIPHLAVRALVAIGNVELLLGAVDGPDHAGALWALKSLHQTKTVTGLVAKLSTLRDDERRQATLTTLVRLYHREGDYTGDWWGTRPDTSGPYYDRTPWAASKAIAGVIRTVIADGDPVASKHLLAQLTRHKVQIQGLPQPSKLANTIDAKPLVLKKADPNDKNQIANRDLKQVIAETLNTRGDAARGEKLFTAQSCSRCHTTANGQKPKGPHLVDIGRRSKPAELVLSILKPSDKITQGFDTYVFATTEGKLVTGFVSRESAREVEIRQLTGLPVTLPKTKIEERVRQKTSMMPDGIVGNLNSGQLADLMAYLQSLK